MYQVPCCVGEAVGREERAVIAVAITNQFVHSVSK